MASPNSEASLPIDTDVKVPAAVAAQAARADAAHKAAYAQANPPQPQPQPEPQPQPQPQPEPQPQPQPQPEPERSAEEWRHAYLSMKGRYEQTAQTVGSLQEQISQLGDELVRTQQLLRQGPAPQQHQQPAPQALSEDDVKLVGPEVVDLIQRAARAAVAPDLANIQQGVQQVNQRVGQSVQSAAQVALNTAVPNWIAINRSPEFKRWCALRDVYSGGVRGTLLRDAFSAGDATRVIAFFQGFLREQTPGQLPDPQLQPALAPARQAAIPLDTLTAPGRAKPPGGEAATAADKPVYTRSQIAAFYADVRRGAYQGREKEKNALEASIFAAQNDGRVR